MVATGIQKLVAEGTTDDYCCPVAASRNESSRQSRAES